MHHCAAKLLAIIIIIIAIIIIVIIITHATKCNYTIKFIRLGSVRTLLV